jgi:uncharacterized DUF497 family protein
MRFEWDPKKAAANLKKHGVTLQGLPQFSETPWLLLFKTRIIPRKKKDK